MISQQVDEIQLSSCNGDAQIKNETTGRHAEMETKTFQVIGSASCYFLCGRYTVTCFVGQRELSEWSMSFDMYVPIGEIRSMNIGNSSCAKSCQMQLFKAIACAVLYSKYTCWATVIGPRRELEYCWLKWYVFVVVFIWCSHSLIQIQPYQKDPHDVREQSGSTHCSMGPHRSNPLYQQPVGDGRLQHNHHWLPRWTDLPLGPDVRAGGSEISYGVVYCRVFRVFNAPRTKRCRGKILTRCFAKPNLC